MMRDRDGRPVKVTRRALLGSAAASFGVASIAGAAWAAFDAVPQLPARVKNVNTTSIRDAMELGCRTMQSVFDADDHANPFFLSSVWPKAQLSFSENHSEAHVPGRHLNALLNAEDALGVPVEDASIEKLTRAAFLSYSGPVPLPLNREKIGGKPVRFIAHNIREGFHALYALVKYRKSEPAREMAEKSVAAINNYWNADRGWEKSALEKMGLTVIGEPGPFVTGIARSLGPLVKYYRATQYTPALELATTLKDKLIRECFTEDGGYSIEKLGMHVHSATCVMSSLAQYAELKNDAALIRRVQKFFDNGLRQVSNDLGWSIEAAHPDWVRGEANNTGDILETALILGSMVDSNYYQRAERILRGHLLPCQLRDTSWIRNPPNPNGEDGKRNVADRHLGAFGFPAPYGHKPVGLKEISFNMDIVGGAVGSLCEAYRSATQFGDFGHRVNLLMDHETDAIAVRSPYTHDALTIELRKPGVLSVRLPQWLKQDEVSVDGTAVPVRKGPYLVFTNIAVGKPVHLRMPLKTSTIMLEHRTQRIRVNLKGDSVVAMENFGQPLTYFDPI